MRKIIDMSHAIEPSLSNKQFILKKEVDKNDYKGAKLPENHDFTSHTITMVTHQGTHIEAPCHVQKNGMDISQIPLDTLCGEAVILDLTNLEPKKEITVDQVKQAAEKVGGIKEGDIVFCNLGYSHLFGTPEYFITPHFSTDSINWLVSVGMKLMGVDIKDIELEFDTPHVNHHIIFDKNIPLVENLTGFDKIGRASCRERV